jgi:prophage regulatory protein
MTNSAILRLPAVILKTQLSRSTIYRLEALGQFPSRVRLGENSTGWHEHEIDEYIANRPRVADTQKSA